MSNINGSPNDYSDGYKISQFNSTSVPLGIGGVFTGAWEDIKRFSMMTFSVTTDQSSASNGLEFQFSSDGITQERSKQVKITAPGNAHTLGCISAFMRVQYTNGAVAQSQFILQTIFKKYSSKELTSTVNQNVSGYNDCQLVRVANDSQLDTARGIATDRISIHKFGENELVSATGDDVWLIGGTYPWLTAASTIRIKAGGNIGDNPIGSGANSIIVEGLDQNWDIVSETIATNGVAASAATANQFIRITRAYVATAGTYTSSNIADIFIETVGGISLCKIEAIEGQTEMSMYSVPSNFTAYLTRVSVSVDSTKPVSFSMFQRPNGDIVAAPFGAKRLVTKFSSVVGQRTLQYNSYIKFNEKTDLWIYAIKDSAGTAPVECDYDLILVRNP